MKNYFIALGTSIWLIIAFTLINYSLEGLTAADSILNASSVILMITIVFISIKFYKLIITLNKKQSNEKK